MTEKVAAGGGKTRPDNGVKRDFTPKQMRDACIILVAAEFTLAGVPAMKTPEYRPGYVLVAQPPGSEVQRISVKACTFTKSASFVRYYEHDPFDWLAIVILPILCGERRSYYVVPRNVCDARFRSYQRGAKNGKPFRELRIDAISKIFEEFRDNFRLKSQPRGSSL